MTSMYDVIIELERLLPSAPFSAEGSASRHFTRVERCIPIAFGLLYASVILNHTEAGHHLIELLPLGFQARTN